MAQVSKYPISSDVYKRCWEIFTRTLIDIRNSKDVNKVMSDLLTPTEQIMLTKRIAIAFLLNQGYEYREIEKILRVSFQTIAMVNNTLKFGGNGYKAAMGKIQRDEKLREDFNQLAQKLVSLPAKGGPGSGAWRYLKKELEKSSKDKKPF